MRLWGITITVLLLAFAIWLCRIVWPPDVLRGQKMRLASIATKNGDHIDLIQLWNGDGYLTKLYLDAPEGTRCDVVIDPDGPSLTDQAPKPGTSIRWRTAMVKS